jgi:tetratricopeptide (TPR) repeat protein
MLRFAVLAVFAYIFDAGVSAGSDLAQLNAALASNNVEQVRIWEQRLLRGSESENALLNAGAALAQHDMLADAAAVFQKCSERFPASFEAKYNLALAQIGVNDYTAAEQSLRSISPRSSRQSGAVQYLQGKIYAATGRPQQAIQSLETAYNSDPDEENYALDLALMYLRSSAYVPAIRVLQPSLAHHPESEELALELALSDALAGRHADALSLCEKLRQSEPNLATPAVIAAFVNCAAANYQKCETEAAAGLSVPHPDPYLYYLHSEALWNSGSQDRSKILFELNTATREMPSCRVCLLLRSRVLEAQGLEGEAIADLKAALKNDPQLGQAWYRLSVLYRNTGQSTEAADAIRHYRTLQQHQEDGDIEGLREQLLGRVDHPPNQ